MGGGEYKRRVSSFDTSLNEWQKNIKAAVKGYDFDGAIEHHNPDGLTVIDFLEEVDGEYFKIASNIRDIYDSLGDGVAFINIQKKGNQEFGRGGEATMEKARLYMSLDLLTVKESSIICALKIVKLKEFKTKNLQGHELHFELTKGAIITPLIDWTPSYKIDRTKYITAYQSDNPQKEANYDGFIFHTIEGDTVRINSKQAFTWSEKMPNIDIDRELMQIAQDSLKKPFLKKKSYMFQLSGILNKKNDNRVQKLDGIPF